MKYIYSVLFLTVLFPVHGASQTETKCEVSAFVADPKSGVNVRSGPGKDNRILKTVPKDEGRSYFNVIAVKGEWLKVDYAENSRNQKVLSENGWVFASLLAIREVRETYKVFESPNTKSKQIDVSLFDHILPLAGCKDRWIKVELPITGTGVLNKKLTGWLPPGSYCGIPWIGCDY